MNNNTSTACDAKSPLDTEIINQCFLLDFDRQAFGALVLNESSGNEEDDDEDEEEGEEAEEEEEANA